MWERPARPQRSAKTQRADDIDHLVMRVQQMIGRQHVISGMCCLDPHQIIHRHIHVDPHLLKVALHSSDTTQQHNGIADDVTARLHPQCGDRYSGLLKSLQQWSRDRLRALLYFIRVKRKTTRLRIALLRIPATDVDDLRRVSGSAFQLGDGST